MSITIDIFGLVHDVRPADAIEDFLAEVREYSKGAAGFVLVWRDSNRDAFAATSIGCWKATEEDLEVLRGIISEIEARENKATTNVAIYVIAPNKGACLALDGKASVFGSPQVAELLEKLEEGPAYFSWE